MTKTEHLLLSILAERSTLNKYDLAKEMPYDNRERTVNLPGGARMKTTTALSTTSLMLNRLISKGWVQRKDAPQVRDAEFSLTCLGIMHLLGHEDSFPCAFDKAKETRLLWKCQRFISWHH